MARDATLPGDPEPRDTRRGLADAASAEDVAAGALRGVGWTAVEQWGGQLVGLATFLLLARLLAPADFGLIAMAGVVIAFLQAAVEQSFSDALVQRQSVSPTLLDTAFWSTVGFGSAAGVLVVVAAGPVALLYSEPALRPVVAVLGLTLPLSSLGATHLAILRRRLDFSPIAKRGLVANLAGGAAAIGIAAAGGGVWSLVAQSLVMAATGTVVLWRAVPWRPERRFRREHVGQLGRFGGNLIAANMVNFANRYADDLIIGLVLGPVALGFYTVAYRLLWAATRVLAGVASAVAFPAFSRLQHEPERLRAAFSSAVRVAAVVSFPVFVILGTAAPEVVTTLFGERWSTAWPVLRVLAPIGLLHSVFYLNTSAFMAAGRPDWVLKLNGLYATLNVLAFALVVRWGILAVAAAYVARGFLTAPAPIAVLRRVIGLRSGQYVRQLMGASAAAGVMAAAVLGFRWAVDLSGLALLAADIVVGLAVYGAAVALFDRASLGLLMRAARGVLRPGPRAAGDPSYAEANGE